MFAYRILTLLLMLMLNLPAAAADVPPLPTTIAAQSAAPLKLLGEARYRKLGFSVYQVSLWTAGPTHDATKPFALQLLYRRDLSRDTLIDGVMDGIREQKTADTATYARWTKLMSDALPDVVEGDTIIGLSRPGQNALLFHNGKLIMTIEDQKLADAFFNVWLGATADEDMRAKLLAQNKD